MKLSLKVTDTGRDGNKVHLLTWNPEKWPDLTDDLINATKMVLDVGTKLITQWSVGPRKNDIFPGDKVFLLRQGTDRRGIIAAGIVFSEIFQEPHWDGTDRDGNYVQYLLTKMTSIEDRLAIETLETYKDPTSGNSFEIDWDTIYSSGRTLSDHDGQELLNLWLQHTSDLP